MTRPPTVSTRSVYLPPLWLIRPFNSDISSPPLFLVAQQGLDQAFTKSGHTQSHANVEKASDGVRTLFKKATVRFFSPFSRRLFATRLTLVVLSTLLYREKTSQSRTTLTLESSQSLLYRTGGSSFSLRRNEFAVPIGFISPRRFLSKAGRTDRRREEKA